jgi:probable H4MPT-linked C1 transfer pathway protein
MRCVGLDIGGANIKASDGEACSVSHPFELWKYPEQLNRELAALVEQFDAATALAVTMTGELADCYATKAEGVDRILSSVERAAGGRQIGVWQTGGEFVTVDDAREPTPLVAAANWHALATWTARLAPSGAGLLIDVGSTTTDLIPLLDGLPAPEGRTDPERLRSGELMYRGVRRTPLCAVAQSIHYRDCEWPLATELFATTGDVWLLSDKLTEDAGDVHTANGRPATRSAAHDRLARQFCSDRDELTLHDATSVAALLAARLTSELKSGIRMIVQRLGRALECIVTSGEGEFLIEQAMEQMPELQAARRVSLRSLLGPEHSRAACAFALARLSMEHASGSR